MKIKDLGKKAVRSTRKIEDFVHLSNDELRKVIGGGGGPDIDPETCATHFHYPADVLS